MSEVYFTSDLHLGYNYMAGLRKYPSLEAHDDAIFATLTPLTKSDVLYVLGDAIHDHLNLQRFSKLRCRKILVAGNHDHFDALHYLSAFENIRGIVKYKNFWLTHMPIHPFEMRDCLGNIHGHVRRDGDTQKITDPSYFNVNFEKRRRPICLEEIKQGMGL